jgi:hypothetical protein
MKIKFTSTLFEDRSNYHDLIFLVQLCYIDRRYDFVIDITEVHNSELYSDISPRDQVVIEEYFEKHMLSNDPIDFNIEREICKGSNSLTLDECKRMLSYPVLIVLENSRNDRYFIESLVSNFRKRSKIIQRYIDHNWIDFVNAGGCENIDNVLIEKFRNFQNLPKPAHFYLRAFVLVDSDSEFPNQIKQSRSNLKLFLDQHNILYHILTKREIENYLPVEAYDLLDGNTNFAQVLKRLTPIQLDYIDIEEGFDRNKNFEHMPSEIKELFDSVSQADRTTLRHHNFGITDFKDQFVKAFHTETVSQESLLARLGTPHGEISEFISILDKINSIL